MDDPAEKIRYLLKNSGIGNFNQETRWIISESASAENAWEIAQRRAAGEPLQYLLGSAPFRNLMLKVDPRVLIPRPETELLAQWIIDRAPGNGSILDLGCGSGAIAIAVATERPDLHVTAIDVSRDALDVAGENASIYKVKNIEFIHSYLFDAIPLVKFDIIGANLPYVTDEEFPLLDREVRDFEPRLALTAPENGMALIRKTIENLPHHLLPGGSAIFELSPPQAGITAGLLENAGFKTAILRDLCNRERFVCAMTS